MNTVFLLVKTHLILFSVYAFFQKPLPSAPLFYIIILILTALSFLIPVIKLKLVRMALMGLSIIIVCIAFWKFPFLLILLPVFLLELCLLFPIPDMAVCILNLAGFPLAFQFGLESLYFLAYGFSILLMLHHKVHHKMKSQRDHNDSLRLANQKLVKRMEYSQSLSGQLTYTAQLEERGRIAQELHDKIGHTLSGSLMQLEAIRLITASDPLKAESLLKRVVETLREGLSSIRVTLRDIKPPQEQMGLNRLLLMVNDFKSKHPIDIRLTHEGDVSRITPIVWKVFMDNTTEALTNIIRHSRADRISLSILVMNKMIRYQIWDNGQTLKPVVKGLGLSGMEERLLLVNGQLLIDNSNGFTLTMLVPGEV